MRRDRSQPAYVIIASVYNQILFGVKYLVDLTNMPSGTLPSSRMDPQRRAWGILLLSFAAFCMICVIFGIGVIYFLFQSQIPLNSTLRVGRGTGVVSGQAVVSGEPVLSNNEVLRTDPQSQISLFFRDSLENDRLIAAVTLRGDTSLMTWQMTRPRFEWSTGEYAIELRGLTGKMDVFVPDNLGRDIRVTVQTKQGDFAYLDGSGQYTLTVSSSQTQVFNRSGIAILIPNGTKTGHSVPVNGQGVIVYDTNPAEVVITDAPVNFLANSTFQEVFTPADSSSPQVVDWACNTKQDDLPRGSFQPEVVDGRSVMQLFRDSGATSHGETRCSRFFGQYGQDVTGYNYLALRATFKIGYQSLNACGQDGSECPMMLQIDYSDAAGVGHRWIHGFYSLLQPQLNYPLQCISCAQEHENIYANTWYTYDTDNLFNLLPPDSRPTSIANVQFYASGHEYDVYVGEVALLAGNTVLP